MNDHSAETDLLTPTERDTLWTAVAEDSWRRSLTEPPEATFAEVERLIRARREALLREFESLADFWALSKGWVGEVALHDFRRKIAVLRCPPEVTTSGGDSND